MWQKAKLALLIVAFLLLLVLTLQNTAATQTNFLFYEVTLPLAASLFLAALLGFAGGILATLVWLSRRGKGKK